jgi:hypothetical protein
MAKVSKQEREFDQSSHSTTHQVPGDLSGPGGARQGEELQGDQTTSDAAVSNIHTYIDSETDGTTREMRISKLAYERAERRGFAPGYELDDWRAAEKEMRHAPSA